MGIVWLRTSSEMVADIIPLKSWDLLSQQITQRNILFQQRSLLHILYISPNSSWFYHVKYFLKLLDIFFHQELFQFYGDKRIYRKMFHPCLRRRNNQKIMFCPSNTFDPLGQRNIFIPYRKTSKENGVSPASCVLNIFRRTHRTSVHLRIGVFYKGKA